MILKMLYYNSLLLSYYNMEMSAGAGMRRREAEGEALGHSLARARCTRSLAGYLF